MFLSRVMHGQEEAEVGGRRRRRRRGRRKKEDYSGTGDEDGQYAFALYNCTVLQNKMEVVIFFSFDCNN